MITVIGNLKGGSGKSTLTFNLGVWLASRSVTVVTYDLDPQRTLSDVAEVRREEGYLPALKVHQVNAVNPQQLTALAGEVLVDVGAANLSAMQEAIGVADRVVIPVPPSQADVWATQRFLRIVRDSVDEPSALTVLTFVNRADTHRAVRESDETEEALGMLGGMQLLSQRLCNRTIYRRSLSEGLTVFEMSPRSKAAVEFGALAAELYPDLV